MTANKIVTKVDKNLVFVKFAIISNIRLKTDKLNAVRWILIILILTSRPFCFVITAIRLKALCKTNTEIRLSITVRKSEKYSKKS